MTAVSIPSQQIEGEAMGSGTGVAQTTADAAILRDRVTDVSRTALALLSG
jgi:hypothetical protein